jgi:hypothetical protein
MEAESMHTFYGSSFEELLLRIRSQFANNTGQKWMVMALGWVLQAGQKTIAGPIRAADGIREKTFSAYYKLFRSSRFDMTTYWRIIQRIVFEVIDEERITLVVDDTVVPKVGREIAFCDWHKEFHGETARDSETVYGQKWVVLVVLWEQPLGLDTVLSLPVQAKVLTRATTPLELGREMVDQIHESFPDRECLVMGDRYFGGRPFLWPIPERLDGMVRLRRNSALYKCPGKYDGRGAPRKKGDRLPTPEQMVDDESVDWKAVEVTRYGETQTVQIHTRKCLWYGVTHDVTGRLVLVKETGSSDQWMALYSTDDTMSPKRMVELYCFRWKIEALFREAKQHGGMGDAQCRSNGAVQRTVPFSLGMVSLVKVWFMSHYDELMDEIHRDDWEEQRTLPSFQIMVQTLRWDLRKKQFSRKMGDDPSLEKKMRNLFNQWTRAA